MPFFRTFCLELTLLIFDKHYVANAVLRSCLYVTSLSMYRTEPLETDLHLFFRKQRICLPPLHQDHVRTSRYSMGLDSSRIPRPRLHAGTFPILLLRRSYPSQIHLRSWSQSCCAYSYSRPCFKSRLGRRRSRLRHHHRRTFGTLDHSRDARRARSR